MTIGIERESGSPGINEILKSSRIELVIFDKDGTMIESEGLHFKAWQDAYKGVGYALSLEDYIQHGTARKPQIFMNTMLPDFNSSFYDNLLQTKENQYANSKSEDMHHIDGFLGLFRRLRERVAKIAVASSDSHAGIKDDLTRIGLITETENPFIAIVSVSDVNQGKPAPDLFIEAMTRSGVTDHSRVLVFEDTPAGVEAAKAGGMLCVARTSLYFPRETLQKAGANFVIADYGEILPEKEGIREGFLK